MAVDTVRWITWEDSKMLARFQGKLYENLAVDGNRHLVYLAPTLVNLARTEERRRESGFWQPGSRRPG